MVQGRGRCGRESFPGRRRQFPLAEKRPGLQDAGAGRQECLCGCGQVQVFQSGVCRAFVFAGGKQCRNFRSGERFWAIWRQI